MEPNLNDIDDFKKPLSPKKRNTILLAFGAMLAFYGLYELILDLFVRP